jgi:hypothetical protein
MTEAHHKETIEYSRAVSTIKTQGILSIVFGALGAFVGLIIMIIFAAAMSGAYTDDDMVGYFIMFVSTLFFWLVPHVYLIVSGVILLRLPSPTITKVLTIINLVIGAFWNIVLLVFAIITLTQSADYELGQPKHHHKA